MGRNMMGWKIVKRSTSVLNCEKGLGQMDGSLLVSVGSWKGAVCDVWGRGLRLRMGMRQKKAERLDIKGKWLKCA